MGVQARRAPVIGLTGGIGSGKSTVADLLVARGAALVDTDPAARKRLEAILHPMIRTLTQAGIDEALRVGAPYVLVAVPLLVESGHWEGRYDRVLVVDCPPETQIERVVRRSGLAREQAEAILAAQATRAQRLAAADDVVDNGGAPSALAAQLDRLHAAYAGLSRSGESDKMDRL
jgi:dephospho-CoA kinase